MTMSLVARRSPPRIPLGWVFTAVPAVLVAGGVWMIVREGAGAIAGSLLLLPGVAALLIILQPRVNPFRIYAGDGALRFAGGFGLRSIRVRVEEIKGIVLRFRSSTTEGGTVVPEHACRVELNDGRTITAYRGHYRAEAHAFAAAVAGVSGVAIKDEAGQAAGAAVTKG
ncbi:MAG TPA: hypothetical protein VFF65_10590 [Phycisphaerales bacterium]|nr:hypothetical protein [Phycisphaerales bacterium]